jgi:hypothetical protein
MGTGTIDARQKRVRRYGRLLNMHSPPDQIDAHIVVMAPRE